MLTVAEEDLKWWLWRDAPPYYTVMGRPSVTTDEPRAERRHPLLKGKHHAPAIHPLHALGRRDDVMIMLYFAATDDDDGDGDNDTENNINNNSNTIDNFIFIWIILKIINALAPFFLI